MGSSWLALARERLKIIASATLFTDCSAVLASIHAAELECWRRYTPGDFRFLAVCESVLSYSGIDAPTAINVYVYLSSSDTSGEALDDLLAQLKALWINPAAFPDGELVCSTVTFDAYETLLDEPAGVLQRAHVTCYFPEE